MILLTIILVAARHFLLLSPLLLRVFCHAWLGPGRGMRRLMWCRGGTLSHQKSPVWVK
jgi:hypothetical protein